MRKILALLLCACAVMSMSTGALAATITETGSQTASTTVTYGVDSSYTVTIPDKINLEETFKDAAIVVRNVLLPVQQELQISLTTDFKLTDKADNSNVLTFGIWNAENGDKIENGDVFVALSSGVQEHETWIEVSLLDDVTKAGEYTGTITFNVEIVTASVTFTVRDKTFTVANGTTWAELAANHDEFVVYDDSAGYMYQVDGAWYMELLGVHPDETISNKAYSGSWQSGFIDFTIAGERYFAIDGWMWEEWIDSDLNTSGVYIHNDTLVLDTENGTKELFGMAEQPETWHFIEAGATYRFF